MIDPADLIVAHLAAALAGRDHPDPDRGARDLVTDLAARDLFLMHLPEARVPARVSLTSRTAAGPIKIDGADLTGMGIRLSLSHELGASAMILNLPYEDGRLVGAWLVARAARARDRDRKRVDQPKRRRR